MIVIVGERIRSSLLYGVLLLSLGFSGWTSCLSVAAQEANESSRLNPVDRASSARARAEAYRTERRLRAKPTEVFAPFYSTENSLDARLIVLNSVTDPVTFELAALRLDLGTLPLGSYRVEPNRHLDIPLDDLVSVSPGFENGTLRLSFLGDASTLQAWLVLEQGLRIMELPLVEPTTSEQARKSYFWTTPSADSSARPMVKLYNRGGQAIVASVRFSSGLKGKSKVRTLVLQAGELRSVEFEPGTGWLTLSHDGDPGDLLSSAYLLGRRTLDQVAGSGAYAKATVWESLPIAALRNREGRDRGTAVLLFNSGLAPLGVTLQTLSSSGEQIGRRRLSVAGEKVVQVDVATAPGSRLRISGDNTGLLVAGSTMSDGSGTRRWLTFFAAEEAHASGQYPLLPLKSHDVTLDLVNLDHRDASIVAQFYWQGGTYAYGPFGISGGSARRLSVEEIVAEGAPDLLGRKLPKDLPRGFLKWKVRSGPRAMLGRVEAQLRDGQAAVGFNCTGCCWEIPYGSIEPSFVDFEHGQSVSFLACVNYDTCSGEMGPYPAYSISTTAPSPFSWDGSSVSASAAAEADLSFSAWQEELQPPDCFSFDVPYDGVGVASACKALLKKAHNPTQFWSAVQACTHQVGSDPAGTRCARCRSCCNAQKAHSTCKRKFAPLVENEYRACDTICLSDHCG
ncbi:MAG: hypothetical protein AAF604_06740 [Acidobacteriota bacterium]